MYEGCAWLQKKTADTIRRGVLESDVSFRISWLFYNYRIVYIYSNFPTRSRKLACVLFDTCRNLKRKLQVCEERL